MSHRNRRDNLFSGGATHRPAYGGNGGGYDEDQASRLLEQDNDAEIARLHAKVARIKQVTLDIRDEVGRQNDFLGEANVDMENTRGLMDQTLNNLNKLLANGGSGHMCMLITFVVAVFLVLYYVIQWK